MKIKVVIDANVIFSALLAGSAFFILFRKEFQFLTTQNTIEEVESHFSVLTKKSGLSAQRLREQLKLLPIIIYPRDYYQTDISKAARLIESVDPKDIDILALSLRENTYLWSQDKHFEKIKDKIKLLKTEDLI